MSKGELSLEQMLHILKTETITNGTDEVRVIDVLYRLSTSMEEGNSGGISEDAKNKLEEIANTLKSNDDNLDTLQEIVNELKTLLKRDLSNLEEMTEEAKNKLKEALEISNGNTPIFYGIPFE